MLHYFVFIFAGIFKTITADCSTFQLFITIQNSNNNFSNTSNILKQLIFRFIIYNQSTNTLKMTDSMKFGPEWLRNMSADTTSSNTINTAGCQLNPAGMFCSVNSSSGEGTSANNSNNSNSANMNNLHNNVNAGNSGASRNTFPEFRYGREEMLLLFDRNCAIPEILPSYKNLFVERVQFPLALVPSTDEEMMQASAPTTVGIYMYIKQTTFYFIYTYVIFSINTNW